MRKISVSFSRFSILLAFFIVTASVSMMPFPARAVFTCYAGTARDLYLYNPLTGVPADGEDIRNLQQVLNNDPQTQVWNISGQSGYPGFESTRFGLRTEVAVQKFQTKYNIVTSGTQSTTGYGRVGPQTRAELSALYGCSNGVATDYNNDGKVDTNDIVFLQDLVTNNDPCPANKVCDFNKDGVLGQGDTLIFVGLVGHDFNGDGAVNDKDFNIIHDAYTNGTLCTALADRTCDLDGNGTAFELNDVRAFVNYVTAQYDYSGDGKLDSADEQYLTDIVVGSKSCPIGKYCDLTGNGQTQNGDVLTLLDLITAIQAFNQPFLSVTSPAANSTCTQGSICNIVWSASGISSPVDISAFDFALSAVGQAPFRPISVAPSSSTGGSYAWTVPMSFPIGTYSIHIQEFNLNVKGDSGKFTIVAPPAVQITFSAAPQQVSEGGATTLSWTTQNANTGNSCTISGGANSGARPSASPVGGESTGPLFANTSYTLSCAGPAGTSSKTIMVNIISEVQNVQVVGMVPGTQIERGTAATVSWTTKGPTGDNFTLALLKNNAPVAGQQFTTTVSSNARNYTWNSLVTLPLGNDYKMRVESSTNSAARGDSGVFSIVPAPSITLAQPIGFQSWQLGSVGHTIQWATAGIVGPVNVAIKLADPVLFYNFDNTDSVVNQKDLDKLLSFVLNSPTPAACKAIANGLDCDLNMDGSLGLGDALWPLNNVILSPGSRIGPPLATGLSSNSFTWNINQPWIIPARDYIISVYDKNNPSVEAYSVPITITPEPVQLSINSVTLIPPPGTLTANINHFTLADTIMPYSATILNKGVQAVSGISLSSYIVQGSSRSEGYNANVVCPPSGFGMVKSGLCTTSASEQQISARINKISLPEYDYNNDGVTDNKDLFILRDIVLGNSMCSSAKVCDVNADGKIEPGDPLTLLNKLALFPTGVLSPGPANAVFELKMGDQTLSTFKLPVVIEPPPGITVLTPNGGEAWPLGTKQTIKWSKVGLVGNVKVELRPVDPRIVYDYNKDGVFDKNDTDTLVSYLVNTSTKAECLALTGLNCDVNGDGVFGPADPLWLMDNILSVPPPQPMTISVTAGSQSLKSVDWTPVTVTPGAYSIVISDMGDPSINDESNGPFTIFVGPPKIDKPAKDGEVINIYEKMKMEVRVSHPAGLSSYKFSLYQNSDLIYDSVRDNNGFLTPDLNIDSALVRKTDNMRVIDLLKEGQMRIEVSGKLKNGGFTNAAVRVVTLGFDRTPPTISRPSDKQEINLGKGYISVAASHASKPISYKVSLYQDQILKYYNAAVPGSDTGMQFDIDKNAVTPQGDNLFRALSKGEVILVVQAQLINSEYTDEATRIFTVVPLPPDYDLNDDGKVDSADLAILQATIVYDAALRKARDEGRPDPVASSFIGPCVNLSRPKPKNCNYYPDFETSSSKKSVGMRIIDSRDAAILVSSGAYISGSAPATLSSTAAPTVLSPKSNANWVAGTPQPVVIQTFAGATGYLVGFFHGNTMIFENYRDDNGNICTTGTTSPCVSSGTSQTYSVSSRFASRFTSGPLNVIVRALVNNQWTEAAVIPIIIN